VFIYESSRITSGDMSVMLLEIARMEEMRRADILVEKSEWKRPLGRPRCRWEDNIRMNVREILWKDVGWMHLPENGD
jgi:hypothetical protein